MDGKDLSFYFSSVDTQRDWKKITQLHHSWTIGVASFKLQRAIAIVYLDNKLCSQRGCCVKQMLKSPRNNITVSVLHEGVQLMSGSKRVDI